MLDICWGEAYCLKNQFQNNQCKKLMKTAAIFKNGRNQAVRLPKDLEFEGVSEVEIIKDGDSLILRPARKSWGSFVDVDSSDPDFLIEREDIIEDGRVKF